MDTKINQLKTKSINIMAKKSTTVILEKTTTATIGVTPIIPLPSTKVEEVLEG